MTTPPTLAQESWSWSLHPVGDDLVLAVVCGSVGIYEVCVALTPDEAAAWRAEGDEALRRLARDVQLRPSHYRPRAVPLPR